MAPARLFSNNLVRNWEGGEGIGRGVGGRQADRKSIRRGFSAWPTHCCRQAGRQASQGRLNTVIISELCLPWPGWPSYTYLLAGWGSQPVIENQPTPRANVSLSLLNSLFQALDYLSHNMCNYKKILDTDKYGSKALSTFTQSTPIIQSKSFNKL